jgi:hypothetical protein
MAFYRRSVFLQRVGIRRLCGAISMLLLLNTCQTSEPPVEGEYEAWEPNVAYRWTGIALLATARDTELLAPRPTITSRYLALIQTAVYDAWSRYDSVAVPVHLEHERVALDERTLSAKEEAISYAAYRSIAHYYPHSIDLATALMDSLGLDTAQQNIQPHSPARIGWFAADQVYSGRYNDGSNAQGENGGAPYSDYTAYAPVNSPDTNLVLERWQPKYFERSSGERFAPSCLTPYWQHVDCFALKSADAFRCGPPPAIGSDSLIREVREVIDVQSALTPQQKALVEMMRDGPQSVQQAGHWMIFGRSVSRRDRHTLDEDVKLYFALQNAAMDAFIACWDSKMHYDFARPYALVHAYFATDTIYGWKGIEKGWGRLKGADWQPYSPASFLCPPFPSHPSGHSTVSGAGARILQHFTGKDRFGYCVERVPGELTEPEHTDAPVQLCFETFTDAAEAAGRSRVLGGYHIETENREGLNLGRNVANAVWERAEAYWSGAIDK